MKKKNPKKIQTVLMKVEEMADVHFLLLPPFFNLNNKIFQLEITIWDKKFNKNFTIDLKMVFQWEKNIIIS